MINYKTKTNDELIKWVDFVLLTPTQQIITPISDFKQVVNELHNRGCAKVVDQWYFFNFVNPNGSYNEFKIWKINCAAMCDFMC